MAARHWLDGGSTSEAPPAATVQTFEEALRRNGLPALRRGPLTTLQVNVGKLCNQACHHCHVDAGPRRREIMSPHVAERVLSVLGASKGVEVVDVTGGAPELCPSFRDLVTGARRLGRGVIDRCNLTILFEPGQEDLADFLARNEVAVVASLPCYLEENVDRQRGSGVFEKSLAALSRLNALGYGRPGSGLALDLVYNPTGASLPPDQTTLEADYRTQLAERYGIAFDRLLTITNMPIRRFADELRRRGRYEAYMSLLVNHFNPETTADLMCRSLVSVGWDGRLSDCDFNQMLELPLGAGATTIFDVSTLDALDGQPIATGSHCFGCTAGAGSSCGGSIT
ncbi:MAG: arsenosugar biosynthesis radical SAM (seleno)protein ArsS [Planctomycetota bacterium]|jgi:radical SAM/Cys-rich protein